MIREREDIAVLQLTRRGDARAVQVAPVETAEVEKVKPAVLLPDHRMTSRHPRIGDDDLTFRAATDDGDGGQIESFVGFDALEVGVQAAR